MFKPGSIRKIQVKNFVTYSYVEMYPGPNLNMIIGPNGTGKSTMVAAIILGLGGSPKVVGRGNKISEYVKHGCQETTINIHLQDVQDNRFIKITREFNLRDKSVWQLNGHRASETDVKNFIKQFNIQVDNLCQFLPQDRVADFAKLNKKELLKETQRALCRTDLIEKQGALIEIRTKQINLLEDLKTVSQNLQESHDAKSRLEGRVQNFNKMMKYKEQIADIDRKIAWTTYEDQRATLDEVKQDKLKAQQIYEKYRNKIEPFEKQIDLEKRQIVQIREENSTIMRSVRTYEGHINTTNEKIEALTLKQQEIEDEMKGKLEEVEQWNTQIEIVENKLRELKKTYSAKQIHDDKKQGILNEMSKYTGQKRQLENQKEQIESAFRECKSEIRALQNEQIRIENVKQSRMDQLRRINNDAYTAVLWLRNNKHRFKGDIFEPIMLELNVLDNSKAKFVESMIPLRDRLAFTCTDKNDMNNLIRQLREEQGLCVNVLHSDPPRQNYNQPNIPIERLRKFGFYTYVNALFTAPEPVMKYLCQTYRLHNVPVGDETTDNCYESIPAQINVFFSDKFRYVINHSKYSGEKSTRQDLVNKDGGLSLSLDIVRLENVIGRANETKRMAESLENQLSNLESQIVKLDEKINGYKEELGEIRKQTQQVEELKNKISSVQEKLNDLKLNKRSPESIRNEAKSKMTRGINAMVVLQETLNNYFKDTEKLIIQYNINSVKVEALRQRIDSMEIKIVHNKSKLQEIEENLTKIQDKYKTIIQEAKIQLQKAKSLSKGFTPADNGFDEFREAYESLTNNMEMLNADKEKLNSKIVCLTTADDGEMREYGEHITTIERLTKDVDSINVQINKIDGTIQRLQNEWLEPLNELVGQINVRFSQSFERMGCAGEVAICNGDDEKNYANYGFSIKVTYRSGEPLQELNTTIQSGGERAVATAAFMLALQELTPVPFRCVDEINQGMDANNERRIFDLIVDTTCQPNTSQYFLITPKLVSNLRYSPQMMVHIVHNGPFINQDQKWGFSKFCNIQGIQMA
ncbi:hypothetical protein ABEB36_003827 [Hypothenemus hampei]|uniref:Structural maintenance of chromosomes protein 5 n=1 Tax=Hypothenemus hampei TaxID=57062 RepID=A0ABD1F3X4_HYPHA